MHSAWALAQTQRSTIMPIATTPSHAWELLVPAAIFVRLAVRLITTPTLRSLAPVITAGGIMDVCNASISIAIPSRITLPKTRMGIAAASSAAAKIWVFQILVSLRRQGRREIYTSHASI
jgi:hypothetical protein